MVQSMGVKTGPFNASGTFFGYSLNGDAPFTGVGTLINIDLGGVTTAVIDVTTLADTVHKKIPGIPDSGEVTFTCNYVPADAAIAQLTTLALNPAVIAWQLQLPDGSNGVSNGTTLTFPGFLSSFAPKGFVTDDKPTVDVTVTISGAISVGAAT